MYSMKKNEKAKELQSRREFFKKAAKGAMPMLAIAALLPSILTSCLPDDGKEPSGCGKSCSGSCEGDCSNNCDSLCGGDCWSYCESKAKR